MTSLIEKSFPYMTSWVQNYGWIEVGIMDEFNDPSFIKALDEGGLVWEGKKDYKTIDTAFKDLEKNIKIHMNERFGEK